MGDSVRRGEVYQRVDADSGKMIVEQKKSIYLAYEEVYSHIEIFLNPLHVKINMGAKLRLRKAIGLSLYKRTLYASTRHKADEIIRQFHDIQRSYLETFLHSEQHKSFFAATGRHCDESKG